MRRCLHVWQSHTVESIVGRAVIKRGWGHSRERKASSKILRERKVWLARALRLLEHDLESGHDCITSRGGVHLAELAHHDLDHFLDKL